MKGKKVDDKNTKMFKDNWTDEGIYPLVQSICILSVYPWNATIYTKKKTPKKTTTLNLIYSHELPNIG